LTTEKDSGPSSTPSGGGRPRTEISVTHKDGRRFRIDPDKYDDVKAEVEGSHALAAGLGVLVVLVLVGLTVYLQYKLGGGWRIKTPEKLLAWGLSVDSLTESWRSLFSHVFVHSGWKHLISNMVGLLIFGIGLGSRQGPLVVLAVYFLGGMVGGVFGMVTAGGAPLIGASGAVFAIMGASALVAPGGESEEEDGRFPWNLALALFFILAIPPLTSEHFYQDRVSHAAHLAGIASGVVLFLVLVNAKVRDRYRGSALAMVLALFLIQKVLDNGTELLVTFKQHGLVLPWSDAGHWGPWLWVALGALGVLGACAYIVEQANEIEAEKRKDREVELYERLAEVGDEIVEEPPADEKAEKPEEESPPEEERDGSEPAPERPAEGGSIALEPTGNAPSVHMEESAAERPAEDESSEPGNSDQQETTDETSRAGADEVGEGEAEGPEQSKKEEATE